MIQRLAYCGLGVSDVDAWVKFGTEALGLNLSAAEDDLPRLRMDNRSWRFALHQSADNDILYAGFEVDSREELTSLCARLDAAGIAWTAFDESECSDRKVRAGVWLRDPDGLRLEVVLDHQHADTPFHSDLNEGFVTGDQGFGHVVVAVSDLDRSIGFYETLGLSMSDFINGEIGPDETLRVAFMHCNSRHHSWAMAVLPGSQRLNHLMVQLNEVDDIVRGHRRCTCMGYSTGEIGRHPNDLMLSFYVTAPGGFDVEYGWGACNIEGEWTVGEYDRFSIWGHERIG